MNTIDAPGPAAASSCAAHDLVVEFARPLRLSVPQRLALRFARGASSAPAWSLISLALDSIASRLSERGLALRSLSKMIESQPTDAEIDQDDALRARLEAMCADVLRGHAVAEHRVERLVRSARLLRGEIRSLMGAIQAHDANVSARRRAALRQTCTASDIATRSPSAIRS